MRNIASILTICFLLLSFPTLLFAKAEDDLKQANQFIDKALQAAQASDMKEAAQQYNTYKDTWYSIEDGVKKKSKAAYKQIESAMGDASFAFSQQPIHTDKVITALKQLQQMNLNFIEGKGIDAPESGTSTGETATVASVVTLLDDALNKLKQNDIQGARSNIEKFSKSWLDIEGVVLTQSSKVYSAAERDMVTAYALLSSDSPNTTEAVKTITGMRDYLAPLSGKSSYTMMDATTILLREGLEALLVVVALLGFLKKSGHEDKKSWIWYGIGSGVLMSVILGILVQMLFSSGAFGSNNFLIAGYTGIFAAVMLLYMSYWLHSKSSMTQWNQYIRTQSTKALATGSLLSLAVLSFLAVFREGTETVLFFIGMASSIDLSQLLLGILIGIISLAVLAFFILKIGLKIPMRPFFLVSSVFVFYLCFKFTGMGIHGLQLAGIIPATPTSGIPTVEFLAFYPTWENVIPQGVLFLSAFVVWAWNKRKDFQLQKQFKRQQ